MLKSNIGNFSNYSAPMTDDLDSRPIIHHHHKHAMKQSTNQRIKLVAPLLMVAATFKNAHGYTILGGIDEERGNEEKDESILTETLRHLNKKVQLSTQSHETSGRVSMAGTLWEASPVLAHYITNPACPVEGLDRMRTEDEKKSNFKTTVKNPTTVVELGSGVGLVSLAAALLGCNVIATDGSPSSIRLLEENFKRYTDEFSVMPRASLLAWGDWDATDRLIQQELFGNYPDLVVASDVIYAHSAKTELADTIKHLCPHGHTGSILIAHRWRTDIKEETKFFESFESEFVSEEVGPEWLPEDSYYRTKSLIDFKYPVSIFHMRRK